MLNMASEKIQNMNLITSIDPVQYCTTEHEEAHFVPLEKRYELPN